MDKILQIIPAPANMYVQCIDPSEPDGYFFEPVACLALIEDAHGRAVRAMTVQEGNYIDIADYGNVMGIVTTNTPPSPLWTGREE